jgi:hypothetical protein
MVHDASDGAVRRISVEVEAEDRVETVIVSLHGQELRCFASDGLNDGAHVRAALRFIAGLEPLEEGIKPVATAETIERIPPSATDELADALDDLLTAVLRVGVRGAYDAPSVDDALGRVIDSGPQPTPPGLSRSIYRLRQALRAKEPRSVARVLHGIADLTDALRGRDASPEELGHVNAWLGRRGVAEAEGELLYDRTMVEVAREWVSGTERASVERRYLVDLGSGRVFREDRPRHAVASVGPCPRELHVGLADVEASPAPARIRVLQYEVKPEVSHATWDGLAQVARQSFAEITDDYRRALRSAPALAEPFVLLKPYRIEHNGVFRAFDAEGHQLVLDREERRGAVLAIYELLSEGIEPTWLCGRLTDRGATLCLVPLSFGTRDRAYVRL